jgi:hypothetical protein
MKTLYWTGVYAKTFLIEGTKLFLTSIREVVTIERNIK